MDEYRKIQKNTENIRRKAPKWDFGGFFFCLAAMFRTGMEIIS